MRRQLRSYHRSYILLGQMRAGRRTVWLRSLPYGSVVLGAGEGRCGGLGDVVAGKNFLRVVIATVELNKS